MNTVDSGAAAVIVPSITRADEAARAVAASFYPPIGARSWGQYAGFAGKDPTPAAESNEHSMCAVMIETAGGYRDLEEIASVPGVGMLFVGPYAGTPTAARRFRELGYQSIVVANDSVIIASGAAAALAEFRS